MSPVAFVASVNSLEAIKVVDGKTMTVKLQCGGLITLNFGSREQLAAVAGSLNAHLGLVVNDDNADKASVCDATEMLGRKLRIAETEASDNNSENDNHSETSGDDDSSGPVLSLESFHINTEVHIEETVESSFESIGDIGLTQEL